MPSEWRGTRANKNRWIKSSFLEYVAENPLRYIASVGVFAYKAIWCMPRAGALLNLVFITCFFGVFFGALFSRNQMLIAAFGLPAGLFLFISFFTHALPRYTMAMTPFVIISVLWLLTTLVRNGYDRLRNSSVRARQPLARHQRKA